MKVYEQVQLIIRAPEHLQSTADEFNHESLVVSRQLADEVDVEVRKPHNYQKQTFMQNAVIEEHSTPKIAVDEHYNITITVSVVNEVVRRMERFEEVTF